MNVLLGLNCAEPDTETYGSRASRAAVTDMRAEFSSASAALRSGRCLIASDSSVDSSKSRASAVRTVSTSPISVSRSDSASANAMRWFTTLWRAVSESSWLLAVWT